METTSQWRWLAQALTLAVPAVLVATALAARRPGALRQARLATLVALALSGVAALTVAVVGGRGPLPVRLDAAALVMLVLVTALGALIADHSRTALAGDEGGGRYARWLLATLAAVTVLVTTSNLLVLAVAWTATSLALHQLLTFYGDRQAALVAAHKKFLVSRLADLCLWSALALVHHVVGSLELEALEAWLGAGSPLPVELHLAAGLVVVAAALKSAQLPFHGWLTQVMEAPTPVSALLHAGVVNLGGFLMIRLAPLMARAPAVQLALVLVGLTTALVAALVMTTRVSVKVGLAWSTIAQMGFMLVQCGLGAWHLALLHLVAHSLYKAHAFLGAGGAVEAWRLNALAGPLPRPSALRLAVVAAVAGAVALGTLALPPVRAGDWSVPALALLVGLAFLPLAERGWHVAAVTGLYVLWHTVAGWLAPAPPQEGAPFAWALVAAGFLALYVTQGLISLRPHGPFARRLHTWLFAGLYLDERFTRLTFQLWPPRFPRVATTAARPVVTLET